MKFYILIILSVFSMRCASQGSPSGGIIDKSGPVIISIEPLDGYLNKDQPIIITFNEYIDQSSVSSSIFINGAQEFDMKLRYNKIYMYPKIEWNNINELYISRAIKDYQKNYMDSPISKLFKTNNSVFFQGEISGDLMNVSDDIIYEIGLYSTNSNQSKFIKKIEADKSGFFRFINIPDGDYRIGAIEGKLNNFEYDYRNQRYGINSRILKVENEKQIEDIKVMISEPLIKLNIISGYLLNGNHAILKLSDGTEKSFFIESNRQNKKYMNGDEVSLKLDYYNRLESYSLGEYNFIASYLTDTIAPFINDIDLNQNELDVYFSEPILPLSNKIFVDDSQSHINHTVRTPFILTAKLNVSDTSDIYLSSDVISDYENNKIDTTLKITIPSFNVNKKFGSLKGEVNYNGKMDIVIKLINNDTREEYYTSTNNNTFLFPKVPQGEYFLESYEKKHSSNEVYYSGIWEPFNKAAQIVIYPDLIDIRAHWEVEGILINF